MTDKERTVWGIHAGKTGDADSLFLKKNALRLVGRRWRPSTLAANREASAAERHRDNSPVRYL
jgi:restriction system protein